MPNPKIDAPLLYSLAPHLVNEQGHGMIYQTCLAEAIPVKIYTSKKASFPGWTPWFGEGLSLPLSYYKLLRQKNSAPRIFLQENFNLKELLYLTLFLKRKDKLWLLFRYDLTHLRCKGKLHRLLLKWLGPRVKRFTDSALIAKQWKGAIPLPIPHTTKAVPFKAPKEPICCYWPGAPREAKGQSEILRLTKLEDARFTLLLSKKLVLEKPTMKVERVAAILPRKEYEELLLACDVVLLPYDKMIYKSSTSGIFVEAIIAGKIPLVKEGSWLAYELQRFDLEELIVDWEDPEFFSQIYPLLFSVQKKLLSMQKAYAEFHTQENFATILNNWQSGHT